LRKFFSSHYFTQSSIASNIIFFGLLSLVKHLLCALLKLRPSFIVHRRIAINSLWLWTSNCFNSSTPVDFLLGNLFHVLPAGHHPATTYLLCFFSFLVKLDGIFLFLYHWGNHFHWHIFISICCNFWFLGDNIEHTILKSFFILTESVLFPGEISDFRVKPMSSHTLLKHANDKFVIRVLFKFQTPTVLHEFFEFRWMAFA